MSFGFGPGKDMMKSIENNRKLRQGKKNQEAILNSNKNQTENVRELKQMTPKELEELRNKIM